VPSAIIDGITTSYETIGNGPPILMFSPGGFDAVRDKWLTLGVYARTRLLHHLAESYTCIVFDRRETGESGGRVERIAWDHYVRQGKGLLDHLGVDAAHVMGGCMGCCPAAAFGVQHPEATKSLTLYWPVGGAAYRLSAHARFARHLIYVEQEGLRGVVKLALETDVGFGQDSRIGPWASVIRRDRDFANHYASLDVEQYKLIVMSIPRTLVDRDTAPGAEPEDMMRLHCPALVIPGRDKSHATSAARYLEECLPNVQYWDVEPDAQTEMTAPCRVIDFLSKI
jgi:pimeloyl-ACP methyl ester carboxylesterase